jgi:hypothetical protein
MLNNIATLTNSGAAAAVGDYESIATINGNGSTATITFSSIPSTFSHLQVRVMARVAAGGEDLGVRLNGDTATNYSRHRLTGSGTAAAASGTASTDLITTLGSAGMPSAANTYAVSIIDVLDYANTNKYKTVRMLSGQDSNGSGGIEMTSGAWRNTAAITSLTIFSNSSNYPTAASFALYGIK